MTLGRSAQLRVGERPIDKIWYYAEGDKPVGPFSLAELKAFLSGFPRAEDVFVWRDGFPHWELARDVPELASFVIKPPTLIIVPPPLPARPSSSTASPTQGNQNHDAAKQKKELVGIGGWLGLLAIGQAIAPVKILVSQIQYYSGLEASFWDKFPITFYGEAMLNAALVIFILYTSYLFFTKSKRFPRFFVYL